MSGSGRAHVKAAPACYLCPRWARRILLTSAMASGEWNVEKRERENINKRQGLGDEKVIEGQSQ